MAETYREDLPDGCPPPDAQELQAEFEVFRLVSTVPPTEVDFISQRAMKPDAVFRVEECLARGLSVWTTQSEAENAKRLPRLRRMLICRVELSAGAGKIMQTFKPEHRTWWPYADYPILDHCGVLE